MAKEVPFGRIASLRALLGIFPDGATGPALAMSLARGARLVFLRRVLMAVPALRRKQARERAARRRVREALGIVVIPIEANEDVFAAIDVSGKLDADSLDNRDLVGEVLTGVIREWASRILLASRVTQIGTGRRYDPPK